MKFKNKKKATYFKIITSIILFIGVSTIFSYLHYGTYLFASITNYVKYTSFGNILGFSFWLGHKATTIFIENKLDWSKNLKKANVISLFIFIIYGIVIGISVPLTNSYFLEEMRGPDLFIDVSVKAFFIISIHMIFVSVYYSTYLTKYWKKAIENNEELKRENLLAKYEALKNQVNPHFLFNSLNTLSGVVEQKPELATGFIKKLSDIYRYVLEQNDKELVSLQDEMKFVEDYIFLSKMRFGDALIFIANLPDNNTIQIVPLGLQMLVENAIKHNVIADDLPLKIEIGVEGFFVVVKNNIQKKTTIISGKEPLGLENLKKRYAYLSGASVEVIESDSKFIVKLPIIEP